jgi:hypothetical protein
MSEQKTITKKWYVKDVEINSDDRLIQMHDFLLTKIGQKLTLIKSGEMGGIQKQFFVLHSIEKCKYAQYDRALRVIVKPFRKKSYYQIVFCGYKFEQLAIYEGYQDINTNVFKTVRNDGNVVIEQYTAFDLNNFTKVVENNSKENLLLYFNESELHGNWRNLLNTTKIIYNYDDIKEKIFDTFEEAKIFCKSELNINIDRNQAMKCVHYNKSDINSDTYDLNEYCLRFELKNHLRKI